MNLTEYLHSQLTFLNDQMSSAKKDKDETMQYLVDSKITEVNLILEALQKGIIDGLSLYVASWPFFMF
ncbi:hypothetical protein [Lentilactobacillus parabuchneri]|uniref:hypothetical protein n=1 Tax=Lentilactobacillus parabuchneri TaxID=152331 RepID=UPI00264928EA|nr:hypothetical protein [Lentilactobacillus parabuchneri]MDN6434818.1 hypothetical protein [Lentilactobacillus parabuchneri]